MLSLTKDNFLLFFRAKTSFHHFRQWSFVRQLLEVVIKYEGSESFFRNLNFSAESQFKIKCFVFGQTAVNRREEHNTEIPNKMPEHIDLVKCWVDWWSSVEWTGDQANG